VYPAAWCGRERERSGVAVKIGEVARRTGLTVRTLRYWEAIGLLPAPARGEGSQRRYGDAEIARLQQIVSLRQLGLGLAGIRDLLDRPETSALAVIEVHLAMVDRRIAEERALRDRLAAVAGRHRAGDAVSVDRLLDLMEAMTMVESHYTKEQLDWLARRRAEVGDERIREVETAWPRLIEEVAAAIDAGIPPDDPRAHALAARWTALVREFSAGDREIEGVVQQLWEQQGAQLVQQHGMNPRTMECGAYIARVLASNA
jgi:DNA-binding transcriptional MerR regulator